MLSIPAAASSFVRVHCARRHTGCPWLPRPRQARQNRAMSRKARARRPPQSSPQYVAANAASPSYTSNLPAAAEGVQSCPTNRRNTSNCNNATYAAASAPARSHRKKPVPSIGSEGVPSARKARAWRLEQKALCLHVHIAALSKAQAKELEAAGPLVGIDADIAEEGGDAETTNSSDDSKAGNGSNGAERKKERNNGSGSGGISSADSGGGDGSGRNEGSAGDGDDGDDGDSSDTRAGSGGGSGDGADAGDPDDPGGADDAGAADSNSSDTEGAHLSNNARRLHARESSRVAHSIQRRHVWAHPSARCPSLGKADMPLSLEGAWYAGGMDSRERTCSNAQRTAC
eukprot:4015975-Pleurochrysis_carterae.AAC.1